MTAIGIDTHKATLAACAVDELGAPLEEHTFANDPAGHRALAAWAGHVKVSTSSDGTKSYFYAHGDTLFIIDSAADADEGPLGESRCQLRSLETSID